MLPIRHLPIIPQIALHLCGESFELYTQVFLIHPCFRKSALEK